MTKTIFSKDLAEKKMFVTREFMGPLELVWQAWTDSTILDQWWAPKPWKAETKTMDFKEDGHWLYCMKGPNGEQHWSKADFKKVVPHQVFEAEDSFCDENGADLGTMPHMFWKTSFTAAANGTRVAVEISFPSQADLETIVAMGFEAGFAAAHENLDQYLQAKAGIRQELKTDYRSRVTTYLNFPGNTEEAFNFYRSVFGTQFSGKGIQRFGDIPASAGHPPVAEDVKKMILHVELPILDGHVLMATDSPKEMGFSVTQGNNMHICLEPSSKAETKKLFDALSVGGTVTMPLEDMFFGSYFGSCTDRFGINWMFNFIQQQS